MKNIDFLLVTCCLEQSRFDILKQVVENLKINAPNICESLYVFDNASTYPETIDLLKSTFKNVYQSSINVGYWTAIDYWLLNFTSKNYVHIIESDMFHYDLHKLENCTKYLDEHNDVGSIRMHEYSYNERHLYDKDNPLQNSKRSLWQSHTNKITGKQVEFFEEIDSIIKTTFLTQLPALNRKDSLQEVFKQLRSKESFTELDFQRLYWEIYKFTGIVDGGMFHCNLNPYGSKVVTGSWTDVETLKKIGYKTTRVSKIYDQNQYNVIKIC